MIYARQSTAIIVTVGPILDADGVAVTDGVVGDLKISKNGAAPAALNGSATLTHRNTGHYSLSLTATDVNTVGTAEIVIDDTVNACPMKEIQVVEEAIYDALFAASANAFSGAAGSTTLTALASGSITAAVIATDAIDADAIADNAIDAGAIASDAITAAKIASDAITAAKIAADAITSAKIADNAITAAKLNADCITAAKIANGAIDAATFAADVDAEILSYLVDDATRIDASALNTLSSHDPGETIMGATDLGTGTGFTAIPWNSAWDAEVQSEVDDALVARNLDHLFGAVDTNWSTTVHVDSALGHLAETANGGYDRSTDSQEAIRDRGDAAWATATGFSTHSAADVWAVGTRSLTILDEDSTTLDLDATIRAAVGLASANLDTQLGDLPTNAELATALGTADDAVLTAIGNLNNITAASVWAVGARTLTAGTNIQLPSNGLDLIVPADPSAIPVLGTATLPQWTAWFGAWSINEVNSDSNSVDLRNSADNANLASHPVSDDGTTFSSGEPS